MKSPPAELDFQQLSQRLEGEIHTDATLRKIYSTDASAYQELPMAVAIPQTESDIQSLIRFANQNKIGIIPRTAGTSLAGQCVGDGIVVDVSKHFTQILEIQPDEGWVRVQPGVIRNELNSALEPHGLLFGPETSTANRAMIGGMLGNNSCGSNSIVYGSTRDHVLEVRGFLSDGSEVVFESLTDSQFEAKCDPQNQSLESQIYRGMRNLLSDPDTQSEIRNEFPHPDIHRRNTGYAVDRMIGASPFLDPGLEESARTSDNRQPPHPTPGGPSHTDSFAEGTGTRYPLNFGELIAGSEGTLFFATEIKLRCVPLPPPVAGLICVHFETVDQALRAAPIAMQHPVFACELMDHWVLQGAKRNIEQRKNAEFVQGDPGALLMIECRDESKDGLVAKTARIEHDLKAASLGHHFPVLLGDEIDKAWNLRKAGLGILSNMPGDERPVAVIEDTAVSLAELPEYIAELNQTLQEKYGIECVHYAHAGAGEIHLRPILNLKTRDGNQQFRDIASDVATLVKKYRGSLSGEHGDGRLRAEFLEQMIGSKNYDLLRKIKQLWDPKNVLNPHKIIGAPPMNTQLRYQPGQNTPQVETILDFSAEQGILRAAELCNGSGDCRKTHLAGGTMCPSYMATKDESATPRARANMLRQVLTEPSDPAHPFDSDELKQVLDLCLSCKGCKSECPSNVDVGKMKAEFQQAHYDIHGVPRRAKTIARFSSNMKMASRAPWLFNWLISNAWTSPWVKRFAGFANQRSLPKLDSPTLRKWFQNHTPDPQAGQRGTVHLFCDEFTNYNDVPVGIATVELLEKIGFQVVLPPHEESGRAALSKGMLRMARGIAESNVRILHPLVTADAPLVGIEPSALLSFRDEYPALVSSHLKQQATELKEHCFTIDEFISQRIADDTLDASQFSDAPQTIRLHGHCHQKAIGSLAATVRMLQLPKNYTVRLIPSGCCGMAGSFGYEAEHYELSMQIGELVLFPTVRNEPEDVLIAAPGTSCRHQIADGTGRTAYHPVEILRSALLS